MAECHAQNKAKLISETRRRFEAEYVTDKPDKYDPRDIERLQQDDNWVENYLFWRHNIVDETLKMLDESFQWRKEMSVNDLTESSIPRWLLELGGIYLHGYDKEGNKLFWIRVKYHVKDPKTILDKKKLIAFWLERYAKRENGKPVTVMFDLSETGINSIDMDFVRFIINCFKVYYPKYLSKMVIFDMPWIMNAAFKIVKSWLGAEAMSLLKFASKNEVQDHVSVEYLPPHMGGTDPFRYSYPPLVDDDFQTPLCENGPIASEDEASSKEDIESDGKETLETIPNEEQTALKKITLTEPTSKAEENEKVDSKMKTFKKPLSVFKGPLLHISPAEELYFGSTESGEKKTLIVLTNVTKNIVAFKVRTTAPEKYRVKPSNSSCDPGASVDIVVSPHGGLTVSAQDRFLIMAAEMEQSSGTGPAELTQFWKEVPRNKVMEHRLRCHIVESSKPTTLTLKDSAFNISEKTSEDIYLQFANSRRASDFSPP
ncbi:motile sperm domain-containing protein 2 isoform X2 [Manis javanica]|uniref:motile sperm domain-containing protein 2 isoform X2 n=1 Tax=Manis javanica TaxID=9974 RepID=UPI0008134C5F|nr:motile sperm domain-containing protein 2 isoform X2 [Manis javanica]KAI5939339.1 Motile sperm domain-containing protein 2 [Manis javanica]